MIDDIHIPGYDLVEHIAKGGMSSVYRARQHIFERDVALKIMRQDLSDDDHFNERFMQESLIVAKLHHSHIVQVYDVGEISDHCFIAMEFLSGGVLKAKMANGLPLKKSVSILKQVASALDFAHQRRIVHRDIKPDNIMFREDGAAVLTDFGIAKDRDADMELTQTGAIMGTPKYMAPEQILGQVIGPATDLYSLGIVFYEMLTGFVPFPGSDFISIAHKHINEPIPQLTGYLEPFQSIINKLLAKDPGERFARAGEMFLALDRLSQHIANEQVEDTIVSSANTYSFTAGSYSSVSNNATGPETLSEADAAVKLANKMPWLIGGALAATVVVAGILSWQFIGNPADRRPSETVLPIVAALVEADGTEKLVADLLAAARINMESNRFKTPENDNAYSKFLQVLVLEPDNSAAKAGIDELARRYADLGMERLRRGDFVGASNYLREAQTLNADDEQVLLLTGELKRNQDEVDKTQRKILSMGDELRVVGLLNTAQNLEKQGKISSPPGDNAIELYQQILQIDPENQGAKEKLKKLR